MFGMLQQLCTSSGAIQDQLHTITKEKYHKTMFVKTIIIMQQALIIQPKGGLREATQHTNNDFPSTWSAVVAMFQ